MSLHLLTKKKKKNLTVNMGNQSGLLFLTPSPQHYSSNKILNVMRNTAAGARRKWNQTSGGFHGLQFDWRKQLWWNKWFTNIWTEGKSSSLPWVTLGNLWIPLEEIMEFSLYKLQRKGMWHSWSCCTGAMTGNEDIVCLFDDTQYYTHHTPTHL